MCVALVSDLVFFKQKTAYELRISDWSSDVCSSDLAAAAGSAAEQPFLESRLGLRAGPVDRERVGHRAVALQRGARRVGREVALHHAQQLVQTLVEIGRASCRERVCQYV